MPNCKFKIAVSSPAFITSVSASLNNSNVTMTASTPRKFESEEVSATTDPTGKIEIDVHVRGRRNAGVTIVVTNTTTKKKVLEVKDVIGSQSETEGANTRYDIIDRKESALC